MWNEWFSQTLIRFFKGFKIVYNILQFRGIDEFPYKVNSNIIGVWRNGDLKDSLCLGCMGLCNYKVPCIQDTNCLANAKQHCQSMTKDGLACLYSWSLITGASNLLSTWCRGKPWTIWTWDSGEINGLLWAQDWGSYSQCSVISTHWPWRYMCNITDHEIVCTNDYSNICSSCNKRMLYYNYNHKNILTSSLMERAKYFLNILL